MLEQKPEEVILRFPGVLKVAQAGNPERYGGDLGYPISIETDPGHIVTIYYMTNDDGITHVAVTHWDVPS